LKQITLVDFSGGYCTDLGPEMMQPNQLLIAQNCWWDGELEKRKATRSWDKIWGTATTIVGAHRVYFASVPAYHNIYAVDNGTSVTFYHSQSSVTATLFAAFNFTTGYNVEFTDLDGKVLAINGVNKPAIMYCTSTFEIMNLEAYDKRDRGTATWWAGQYYDTGSSTGDMWTSNTDNAQSSATSDFTVCNGSGSNGFWLACNYTFNKVYLYNCNDVSGTYGAAYEYYNSSSTWSTCAMISSADFNAATATRTIEFTWPSNWGLGDSYFTDLDDLANHYIFRCRLSTAPSASFDCGSIAVEHTQYLTEVMYNDRPQAIAVHNRRVHMAAGNNVFISDYGSPTGWELKYCEYFLEGGTEIKQMVPYQDYLAVIKENALFGFYGTGIDTWVKKRLAYGVGTVSKRSAAEVGNDLFFAGRAGIFMWNGVNAFNVSKHIYTDYSSYVATTAAGINYNGEYWISFPSSTITLRCDPDSFKVTKEGDGRVGWYKTPLGFTQFVYNRDGGDNGYFFGVVKCTATTLGGPHLCQLEYDRRGTDRWCGSTTAIEMVAQTPYIVPEVYGAHHGYRRILPRFTRNSPVDYNMVERASCETATAPMIDYETTPVLTNSTWAATAAVAHTGSYSYLFTRTTVTGVSSLADLEDTVAATNMHGVMAGKSLTFRAWFYVPTLGGMSGTEAQLQINQYNGGAWSSGYGYGVNTYDSWQQVTVTSNLESSTTGMTFRVRSGSTASLNTYFYVDDIEIFYSSSTVVQAIMANNSSVTVTITAALEVDSGYQQPYYTIPYTLDGKNLSYYFKHSAPQTTKLAGVTFEGAGRYL
jgi:hypothetical protein